MVFRNLYRKFLFLLEYLSSFDFISDQVDRTMSVSLYVQKLQTKEEINWACKMWSKLYNKCSN